MKRNHFRSILSQGDNDGACFLYSLANAALCLGADADSVRTNWSAAVSGLRNPRAYLDYNEGTRDNTIKADVLLGTQFLDALCPDSFVVSTLNHNANLLAAVEHHLNQDSVLVIDNQEHWFCIVDVRGEVLHAACSGMLNEPTAYEEWTTATRLKLERRANARVRSLKCVRLLKVEKRLD